jgi:hypothetical protein
MACTPIIEQRKRVDGSAYFLGWLEELPGVLVCEDTFDEALQALWIEAAILRPQLHSTLPRSTHPAFPE